jgi:small subunit ribosomal protein S6
VAQKVTALKERRGDTKRREAMALYEHIFIARQDISAQQVEGLVDLAQAVLEENGGKITKNEYWGLKSLAYRVKKNRKGHYTLLNIEADHTAVAELERRIGLNDDIIRHMTLRVDEHETDESVQMRNKNRDERRSSRRDEGNFERSSS